MKHNLIAYFSDDLLLVRFVDRFLMLPLDVFVEETTALVRPEFGVEAVFFQQFGVAAFFDDAAFVQDDEPVHRGDGGEAMGDGDDGFAVHHFVEIGRASCRERVSSPV